MHRRKTVPIDDDFQEMLGRLRAERERRFKNGNYR